MNLDSYNYEPGATIDDGSCVFEGCTNPNASNYDPEATEDDGSCCIELWVESYWGECHNIEETTSLELGDSGLIGDIPPEMKFDEFNLFRFRC